MNPKTRRKQGPAASSVARKAAPRGSVRRRESPRDVAAAAQATRFDRVRRDHSSEIAEDYVELIAQLTASQGEARAVDIAKHLGVSHVTVTKTIGRLRRDGLVRAEPYRSVFLTESGRKLAEMARARHELVVRFLRELGVSALEAEVDAEGVEHHLSEATLRAIRRFVERGGLTLQR